MEATARMLSKPGDGEVWDFTIFSPTRSITWQMTIKAGRMNFTPARLTVTARP
jgi:hypothetical protein